MRRAPWLTSPQERILASVGIAVPPERVFAAFASSEIAAWWGKPGVFDTREWSGEVQVGGRWRATGLMADGRPWALEGEFLEIAAPRKLVHTWETPGSADAPSVVTYLLDRIEGGTRLTLGHTGVVRPDGCMGACMGWEACLTQLARALGPLNA